MKDIVLDEDELEKKLLYSHFAGQATAIEELSACYLKRAGKLFAAGSLDSSLMRQLGLELKSLGLELRNKQMEFEGA